MEVQRHSFVLHVWTKLDLNILNHFIHLKDLINNIAHRSRKVNRHALLREVPVSTLDPDKQPRFFAVCLKQIPGRNFQMRHPRCVDRITSRVECSETQLSIFILPRGVYKACLNNYMLWPL